MNIKNILEIAIQFLFTPLFLGYVWQIISLRRIKRLSEKYITGYITLFVCFEITVVPMLIENQTIAEIAVVWFPRLHVICLVAVILAVAVVPFGVVADVKEMLGQKGDTAQTHSMEKLHDATGLRKTWQSTLLRILICGAVMLFSLFFTVPSEGDATEATIYTNMATDTLYEYQPYSGDPYGGMSLDKQDAPWELFFQVVVEKTGLSVNMVVEMVGGFFLLLLFFATMYELGNAAFAKARTKQVEEQATLSVASDMRISYADKTLYLAILLYLTLTFLDRAASVHVFRNIWNYTTLLTNVMVPIQLIFVLRWVKENRIIYFLLLLLSAGAAQLLYHYGFMFTLLVEVVPAVIVWVWMRIFVQSFYEKKHSNKEVC